MAGAVRQLMAATKKVAKTDKNQQNAHLLQGKQKHFQHSIPSFLS
jgi:hypothetical protein